MWEGRQKEICSFVPFYHFHTYINDFERWLRKKFQKDYTIVAVVSISKTQHLLSHSTHNVLNFRCCVRIGVS